MNNTSTGPSTGSSIHLMTPHNELTRAEHLKVFKGNFNFLVTNYLGLQDTGARNSENGKYELSTDVLFALAQRRNIDITSEADCPVKTALLKIQKQGFNEKNLEHSLELGRSSAHVWYRAKSMKQKKEDPQAEEDSILPQGDIHFSHSYIFDVLSLLPIPNRDTHEISHKTIMDIFDEELTKIENSPTLPSCYLLSVKGGMAKIVSSIVGAKK